MSAKPLFQDTSILFDRIVERYDDRGEKIDQVIEGRFLLACSFAKLELKSSLLQKLQRVLNYLVESGSFGAAWERADKNVFERGTVQNIARWIWKDVQETIEVKRGDEADRIAAIQGIALIRIRIRGLWKRIGKMAEFTDKTECARAREAPTPQSDGSIDCTIHESACRERKCRNSDFFRERLIEIRKLIGSLRAHEKSGNEPGLSAELLRILESLEAATRDADSLYNYRRCRNVGDAWHHLECVAAKVKEFFTRNHAESQHLCPHLGLKEVKLPT